MVQVHLYMDFFSTGNPVVLHDPQSVEPAAAEARILTTHKL